VSTDYPCGFCGQSMLNGACHIRIHSNKAISTCKYAYTFVVSATAKMSKVNPCTNVPEVCKIPRCNAVHWKYNMLRHLMDRHPSWEEILSNEEQYCVSLRISIEEQEKLGVP
ncbi:hypothetical protein BDQ17DRAFT_1196460, partial [Cyathus striatus]